MESAAADRVDDLSPRFALCWQFMVLLFILSLQYKLYKRRLTRSATSEVRDVVMPMFAALITICIKLRRVYISFS